MKDFRGMKRQRSRNRKPSGNQNNPNRAYESNGPEGTKVRGNAQTIYEKYQQLARDANSSGDRVLAENHLQHAEHYFRMIRQMQPQRPVSEFVQRDPFSSGFDLDYDDDGENEGGEGEAEAIVTVEEAQPGLDEPRYDTRRNNGNNGNGYNNRDRDGRNNRDRQNGGQNGDRQNGEQRSFEPRNTGNNGGNRPNNDRVDRVNGEAAERIEYDENGNRRETRRERYERRRMQRLSEQEQNLNGVAPVAPGFIASTEPLGAPARSPQPVADLAFEPAASEQPVVRERPRKDADHLPAFIRKPAPVAAEPAPAAAEAEPDAKPKRGRPKRKAEDVGAAEEA
ncbi:MAG: DUF4167 domain-containing protein [Asticcacaulis sp.]